jgi:hypothetical protein
VLSDLDPQQQSPIVSPRLSNLRGKLGFIDEDGVYVVPDSQSRRDIMRLYMFMHDNKNEHIALAQRDG